MVLRANYPREKLAILGDIAVAEQLSGHGRPDTYYAFSSTTGLFAIPTARLFVSIFEHECGPVVCTFKYP